MARRPDTSESISITAGSTGGTQAAPTILTAVRDVTVLPSFLPMLPEFGGELVFSAWASDMPVSALVAWTEGMEDQLSAIRELLEAIPMVYNTLIYDVGRADYTLTMPLMVTIEENDEEAVASLPEFALYAAAPAPALAIAHLKREFIDAYEDLEAKGLDRLGPPAAANLMTMRRLLERHYA